LAGLEVGKIPVPEESALTVGLTLGRIFSRMECIYYYVDESWEEVLDAVRLSRQIIDCSGKDTPSLHLEVTLVTSPQEPHSRAVVS
jgi:hypothetical protein